MNKLNKSIENIFFPNNMYSLMKFALSLSFIILFSTNSFSQNTIKKDTIEIDSAEAVNLDLFNKDNKNTFKILFSGKPARAALYSVIPGLGQIYNKKYWYAPIIWAGLGYFGYKALKSTMYYKKSYSVYRCLKKYGDNRCHFDSPRGVVYTSASLLRPEVDKLHSIEERNWVTFGIIYIVQIIHAYIQRHLVDFDLNENLSITPSIQNRTATIGVTLNINSKR